MELADLNSSLLERCRSGERFRDALALHLMKNAKLWMALAIGLSASAGWLTTTAGGSGDRPWAEITQGQELLQEQGSSGFEVW